MGQSIPDMPEVPAMMAIEPVDPCIGFEFDNYVYTIIERTFEFPVTTANGDVLTSLIKISTPKIRVMRSYSREADAKEFSDHMNTAILHGHSVLSAWVWSNFQTTNIAMKIDPANYDYLVSVKKYEYVKNELHGSVMEKEPGCH